MSAIQGKIIGGGGTHESNYPKKAALVSLGSIDRLKLVKEVIQDEYEVTMFLCDFSHNRKAEVVKRDPECVYLHIPPYKKNLSIQRIISLLNYGKQIGERIRNLKPDLIYIILPPNNMIKNCESYLRANSDVNLVLDIYDLWPESMPINKSIKGTFPFKMWADWRNRNLGKAKVVFTECMLYQDVLNRAGLDAKYETLYLCKSQRDDVAAQVKEIIENRLNENSVIRMGFLGAIKPSMDIDITCRIISGLKNAGKKVEVEIIGEGECTSQFISGLEGAGASVKYHGPIYDEMEILRLLGKCDLGINMMKPGAQVGLTTKGLDYLSMGLPLMNNIKGDTWTMIQNEKIGFNVSDDGRDDEMVIERIINMDTQKMRDSALRVYEENFTPRSFKRTVKQTFIREGIIDGNKPY